MSSEVWATSDLLRDVISREEDDDGIRVVGSEVHSVVGAGDNNLGVIYSAAAEFVRGAGGGSESRRFIVKALPTVKCLRSMVLDAGIFRKELYMYESCLPAMRRLAEEHLEGDFIAPAAFKSGFRDAIVLEDLKLSGYRMAQRRKQLDFRHSFHALRCLARFHALAHRLVRDRPDVVDEVSRSEFFTLKMFYGNAVKAVASWLRTMSDSPVAKHLVPVMEKATVDLVSRTTAAIRLRDGLLTLNHGDAWTNNFMFKYDDDAGSVLHARLVDFQMSRYASPALDLLYFFYTSPQPDMLLERVFELVRVYRDALAEDMKQLGADPGEVPTTDDLLAEMKKRSIFAYLSLLVITPIVVSKPSDAIDLTNVDMDEAEKSDDYLLEHNFKDSHYQELIVKYAAVLEKMGYLPRD